MPTYAPVLLTTLQIEVATEALEHGRDTMHGLSLKQRKALDMAIRRLREGGGRVYRKLDRARRQVPTPLTMKERR